MTINPRESATAAPADSAPASEPPPLAALDASGTATVISYQVPEPTSYEGRHVIAFSDYELGDFADVVASGATSNAGVAPPATAAVPAVSVPRSVVTSDSSVATNAVVSLSPFDLAPRLAALTWAQVQTATAAGKRIEVFRSIGGLLDYRVRDLSQPASAIQQSTTAHVVSQAVAVASNAPMSALAVLPALQKVNGTGGGGVDDPRPYLILAITAPSASNPQVTGPWYGVTVPLTGTFEGVRTGTVTIQAALINSAGATITSGAATIAASGWSASLPVTASGNYKVEVTANSASGLTATKQVPLIAALDPKPTDPPPPPPPATAPSVMVDQPTPNTIVVAPSGNAILTVAGTADTRGGSAMTVTVVPDGGSPSSAPLTLQSGTVYAFTTTVELSGNGSHQITVNCVNADGLTAPAITLNVSVSPTQPVLAVDRRLVLVEKVAISSFLGSFGASRVVKTFTLLPGEQTQISVDSYMKDESTTKSAQSILDSTATECAADFEDTVNSENDTKASNTDATAVSISADVGGSWGFAHADIKGSYSDQTNASREQMAKNVQNALAKHTSKASSNRSVNVNTDFTETSSSGTTTDTSRTLKNINVSRVLNFVFRQMTQEHVVLTHLVDATLGYYKLDILLDATGQPQKGPDGGPLTQVSFAEYTLPEVAAFQRGEMTGAAMATLQQDILSVLTNISDINGNMQSLVELVTPNDQAGNPLPDAAYLRVKKSLSSDYTATGGATFTVPGILLNATKCVMRTDQLLCDAILGEGDALDTYSHALQDVAIAERQAAVDERNAATAREKLAQQIVANKDADMAAIYQKIYPAPLSVPATITVPASVGDGTGVGQSAS
jgi:hypothetical protein